MACYQLPPGWFLEGSLWPSGHGTVGNAEAAERGLEEPSPSRLTPVLIHLFPSNPHQSLRRLETVPGLVCRPPVAPQNF